MKIHSWDFGDKKAIIQTTLFLGALSIVIFFLITGPRTCMLDKEKKFDTVITATITHYKINIGTTRYGALTKDAMTIEYTYTVDAVSYQGVEVVLYDAPYKRFLDSIYHSQLTTISIKYLSKDPTKSMINLK